MHQRVIAARGAARTHRCLFCAEVGRDKPAYDWAQIHETAGLDIADYVALCRCCHLWYDRDAGMRRKSTEARKAAHKRKLERYGPTTIGSTHPLAKLTEEIVRECRIRHAAGESQVSLAREFGVHKVTMGGAIRGERWRHVA